MEVQSAVDTGELFERDGGVNQVNVEALDVSASSVAIIEGSSGDSQTDVELAERLDASIVLVVGLDEEIEPAAAAYGDRLAGVILNKVPRYRDVHAERRMSSLEDEGIKPIGWVPDDRRMAANTIDSLISQLDGKLAFEINTTDELIDNVLIGGLVLDWGPFYFRSQDNTCVVVRSGRPDVQISALQSETTKAMVLTGGDKPIDYVFYEARAKRIPLITVDGDTQSTLGALDEIATEEFTHPDKLGRMNQLVAEREIIDGILDLVAQPPTR